MSQPVWTILTGTKWVLLTIGLPFFRLPDGPIFSSLLILIAMFGHFAIEHATGVHWKQLEQMARAETPQWLYRASQVLNLVAVISWIAILCLQRFISSHPHLAFWLVHGALLCCAAWFIAHCLMNDLVLKKWYQERNKA